MRWLFRLSVVLILCLIGIALPTVVAQAECVSWGIELNPEHGPPGTEVEVSGHDFAKATPVDIYYGGTLIVTGKTDRSGAFTLRFTVPERPRGPYEVKATVGTTVALTYFNIDPGLIVTPAQGPVGTSVTVEGKGFAKDEEDIELYFDGQLIESGIKADAKGSWETTFQIPQATRGEHKLDAQGAVSKSFEVKDAIFRVTAEISIDKSSGIVGDTVTVTGSRFSPYEKNIQILFDGQAVATGIKANSKGEWQASFVVPDMPTGEYSVTARGEQTRKEDLSALSFEIKPNIVLSATQGHVGMDLTVTGYGFAANQDVVITYDGVPVTTDMTNDQGSFMVSFLVPASQHGQHKVAAGYAANENHANAMFTMEAEPPPTPKLISPANRSRLGLMGTVTPTLEWSAVSDDSGVSYNLQIATSDDFAPSGGFANPLVSLSGLTTTTYALNETQALPYGTYYWAVQAVDGAENAGDWSAAQSFRVGLLPQWAFIAIIAAIVALIVALVYFLIVSKRRYD